MLILLLTDALYLTGLFTFVGLKFPGAVHRQFQLEPSSGRNTGTIQCVFSVQATSGINKQWTRTRLNKPGQLNPDTMKVNYSPGRLGATTRRAGKGYIKTCQN